MAHARTAPASACRAAISLLLPAALVACTDEAEIATCLPDPGGLPVMAASGQGSWAREGLAPRLVELWRAGGLNEGEELVYPVGIAASPDGRIAIPDFQLAEVVVVERDGTWRGPWARRGKGPGELTLPAAATWNLDEVLTVYDLSASKVLFLRDGESAREDVRVSPAIASAIYLAGELPWTGVQSSGTILLQPPPRAGVAGGAADHAAVILRFAPGAEHPDTMVRTVVPAAAMAAGVGAPGWPRISAAIGTDGQVAIGGIDSRYRITLYDSTGRVSRQLCRDTAPLPLSAAERGELLADDFPADLRTALLEAPLPDTLAPYGRLFWGARGRLWVQRERNSTFAGDFRGVPGSTYDVFAADGEYLGEVAAPAEATLQAASGDTVYAFVTGDLDETSVVAYHLTFD